MRSCCQIRVGCSGLTLCVLCCNYYLPVTFILLYFFNVHTHTTQSLQYMSSQLRMRIFCCHSVFVFFSLSDFLPFVSLPKIAERIHIFFPPLHPKIWLRMGRRSTPQECSRPQLMLATPSLASPTASQLMVRFLRHN